METLRTQEAFRGEDMYQQLDLMRSGLAAQTYPGYPTSRLVVPYFALERVAGRIVLPDGPWAVDPSLGRGDPDVAPDMAKQWEWAARGFELDASGNPLHPWLKAMIEDPTLGVVTGKGYYYERGPNDTADAIIKREDQVQGDKILLVQRKDTGIWALPAGHVDEGEIADETARRETTEETGFVIPAGVVGNVVYQGPVADLRMTAHAWPETTAIVYKIGSDVVIPKLRAQEEEVLSIGWFTREQVRGLLLHGSHNFLIAKGFGEL